MPHGLHRSHTNGRAHLKGGQQPRRKVVLVVEDHASVGGLIAGLLRQDGYRVVRAWSTQEALRAVQGRHPDAVVLDLNLPYPDGLEALRFLRGNESTRRSPVVLVTGTDVALSPEERGAVSDVVPRPFDIDIMLNAVRKAVGDPLHEIEPRQYDAQDYFLHGY